MQDGCCWRHSACCCAHAARSARPFRLQLPDDTSASRSASTAANGRRWTRSTAARAIWSCGRTGGTLCLGGDEAEFRWQLDGTALTLTSGRETCRGTLENGRIETDLFGADIRLSFPPKRRTGAGTPQPEEAGPAAEDSPEPDAISWPGDWYGWYAIVDAGSDYDEFKDSAWAACARITRTEDTGSIEVWDTETAAGERIGKMKIRFAKGEGPSGSLALKSGKFWDETLQKDGWSCDPARTDVRNFPQMICLSALAGDPASDSWFRIRLYLRPWGVDWSDVRTGM